MAMSNILASDRRKLAGCMVLTELIARAGHCRVGNGSFSVNGKRGSSR